MKNIKYGALKALTWIVCLSIPATIKTIATMNGYNWGALVNFVMYLPFDCVAIFIHLKIRKMQMDLKYAEQEKELSRKTTSSSFEKILDNSAKEEGEDSIAYIARCMRESEKEKHD